MRTISLIGTTSSGKSTLANLLCGHYILPTGVQETTTCVVELIHDATCDRPILFLGDVRRVTPYVVPCTDDADARSYIADLMLGPEFTANCLRLQLAMFLPIADSLPRRQRARTRRCVLKPRAGTPRRDVRFTIQDFPGFQHAQDNRCLEFIEQFLNPESIPLFLFNAEETDHIKEEQLLRAFLKLIHSKGGSWQSIIFVLNRMDAFVRDHAPECALQQALQIRQMLIQRVVTEIWQINPPHNVKLIPLSSGVAFAAEMLCHHGQALSKTEHDHLRKQIVSWSHALLPGYIREDLPRSVTSWCKAQWLVVYRALLQISGRDDLLLVLRRKMSHSHETGL